MDRALAMNRAEGGERCPPHEHLCVMPGIKAAAWAQRVLAHRALFQNLGGGPLHTLGAPAYQTGSDPDLYRRSLARLNGEMWFKFEPLYRAVFESLERSTGRRVRPYGDAALPGFHVFLFDGAPHAGGSAHFDLSHQNIQWPADLQPDSCEHLSYTLMLRSPACGGGLEMFNFHRFDRWREDDVSLEAIAARHEPYFAPMGAGEMLLFDGGILHRIAPTPTIEADDCRVTLQGHLVPWRDGWLTFW